MDEQQDREQEVTLGTGKLLGIFFGLVILCGIFFALGYSFGRANAPIAMQEPSTTSPATVGGSKPTSTHTQTTATAMPPAPVPCEGPGCSPATTDITGNQPNAQTTTPPPVVTTTTKPPELGNGGKGFIVQVAAVTKQEDADALVSALRGKQYPVFVVAATQTDRFFHVQVGPFASLQEAEAMRTKLVSDGYNAILKK